MSNKSRITATINGEAKDFLCEPRQSLLEALRDILYLTGTKEGCNDGNCGACSVIVDGVLLDACCMLAVEADGSSIETIEGLATGAELHPLQQAFLEETGMQCGICTPGFLVSAKALLDKTPRPDEQQVRHWLAGEPVPLYRLRQAGALRAESGRHHGGGIKMSSVARNNGGTRFKVIGTTPLRPDGLDKVTGRALFADDFHLPGMLHGKILRSPHAHARIKSIDTRAAQALPGVRAVVTGADFPPVIHEMISQGMAGMINVREMSENCMAKDKVLYDGHALAAVAADNPHVAEQAVNLIEVDYELLAPVMNVRAAMADDAPVIHENYQPGSFIAPTEKFLPNATRLQLGNGDTEQGFAEADLILERDYTAETIHQGYIESHITTVNWDNNDYVTVWTATQGQFGLRDHLADIIQVPMSNINVVPLEIGGGFGGKERIYIDPVAAMLSKKSQCPVKIAMRRDEVFRATGPSSGTYIKLKFGVKQDGTITAADLHMAYEAGAYAGGPLFLGILSSTSRYNIPNILINGFDVIVNKPTMRPYRAPGAPQALFAVEQMIDELAYELDMDPIDFRMQNLARTGDRLVPGFPLAPIDTEKLMDTVRAHPHYQAPLDGPNQGRGLAYSLWFNLGETSSARMQVNPDGSVTMTTASPDLSGTRISLAMQAAEMLGIGVEQVSPLVSDTQSIGFSLPSVGSRTTYGTGAVVCEVAQEILRQMCERAALLWETDADQVSVDQRGVQQ